MELKQFVLSELAKLELGIKVVDVTIESASIVFVVAIEDSNIEFLVNESNQFQIKSVLYEGQKHTNPEFLSSFNDFVASIIPMIQPVALEKIEIYNKLVPQPVKQETPPAETAEIPQVQTPQPTQLPEQEVQQEMPQQPEQPPQIQVPPVQASPRITQPQQEMPQVAPLEAPPEIPISVTPTPGLTIEEREIKVTQKEEQLKKRALAIQARARLLEFQMQAVDVESHFFEELKERQTEPKDIKTLLKRGRFIFEWIIMLAIALLIVAFLIANTR